MTDMENIPIKKALLDYMNADFVSFDVPGHKKNGINKEMTEFFGEKVLKMDANSMKCLDNLQNPLGVIREAQNLMAKAYDADRAFFLVNGTTSGIQIMIFSALKHGEKILLPRNAHKSVINSLILSGVTPEYIDLEYDNNFDLFTGVHIEKIEEKFKNDSEIKAILLINPSYYGVCCDLEEIIKTAKKYNKIVLVDEAHGAHFKFNKKLPKSAIELGADMVATSLHKTGGSLTQSSVLLLNKGNIDEAKVEETLNIFTTTSASYLLLSSLDIAREYLVTKGSERLDEVIEYASYFKEKMSGYYDILDVSVLDNETVKDFDLTKLVVNVSKYNITGFQLYDILRDEYRIQVELADFHNILCILSIGDSKENVDRLISALIEISAKLELQEKKAVHKDFFEIPEQVIDPRTAYFSKKISVNLRDSIGKISGEMITVYPPGIPIISYGERIEAEIIDYLEELRDNNCVIDGIADKNIEKIKIIEEE